MVGRTILAQRQMIFMKSEKLAGTETTSAAALPPEPIRLDDRPGQEADVHGAPLAFDIQSQIGRQLQAVYDEVLHEPVPDRFLKLLQDLDRKKGGV